jgi:DNA-binding transcriptional MerR regulator
MRISTLAARLGCSAAWIRDLERAGRVPRAHRDVNGHRRYTAADVSKLRAILFRTAGVRRRRTTRSRG